MRDIHTVLRETWGYPGFRPMQEQVVRSALGGNDTLALLPTGGGKSLCFQVPALAMGKLCIVVSPLIALMKDQVQRLKQHGVRAVAATSGMAPVEIDNALESAANGKLDFLYVSPERLGSELFKARLPRMPLGLIAVDEAHCISQWGYDFRPAYLLIGALRETHPEVPVLALTASATPEVAKDIMERLAFRKPNLIQGSFSRPELTLWASHAEDKLGRLLRIAHKLPGSGIVYLRNRRGTVRTAQFLQQHGIRAAAYHAGLALEERDRVQQEWTSGNIRFVAATNAFGMGIDKADVRCVVHLEPRPTSRATTRRRDGPGATASPHSPFCLPILPTPPSCANGLRHPSRPSQRCAACTRPLPTCTASRSARVNSRPMRSTFPSWASAPHCPWPRWPVRSKPWNWTAPSPCPMPRTTPPAS